MPPHHMTAAVVMNRSRKQKAIEAESRKPLVTAAVPFSSTAAPFRLISANYHDHVTIVLLPSIFNL